MSVDNKIISIYKNFFILTNLDYKYYNVIFTEKEIILDFINRSFKPWIIRTGIYKENEYENITLEEIKSRHEENLVINYDDIENVDFSKRTFIKNAHIKILYKNKKVLTLITKDKQIEKYSNEQDKENNHE